MFNLLFFQSFNFFPLWIQRSVLIFTNLSVTIYKKKKKNTRKQSARYTEKITADGVHFLL